MSSLLLDGFDALILSRWLAGGKGERILLASTMKTKNIALHAAANGFMTGK
jgi:hypothetical protein